MTQGKYVAKEHSLRCPREAAPSSHPNSEENGTQGDEPTTPKVTHCVSGGGGAATPVPPPPNLTMLYLAKGRVRESRPRPGLAITTTDAALLL